MQALVSDILGVPIIINTSSGLNITRQGDTIFITPDVTMTPVDARAASGNIVPETSGTLNIGASDAYINNLFVDNIILGSGQLLLTSDNLKNGWGLSGITVHNNNIYIHTSGFLTESGIGWTRRHIYTHDWSCAGTASRSQGIFTVNSSGTATVGSDNKRLSRQLATAATAGAVASVGALVSQLIQPQHNPSMRFDIRTIASGSAVFWGGLINKNPRNSGVTELTSCQSVILSYHIGETGWRATVSNGTTRETSTISNNLLPLDGQWHDIHIHTPNGGIDWYFEVDDKLAAAFFGSASAPTSGANLGPLIQASPTAATAISYRNSYLNVRCNAPNPLPNQII